jgi:hypothetical protein
MWNRLLAVSAELALAAASVACASGPPTPPVSGTSTGVAPNASISTSAASPGLLKITDPYSPTIDPSAFTTKVDNPYFPLTPGTRTIYEAATQDGLQRTTTEVTRDIKNIMGVDTVVVHDTVTVDNEPHEDTLDWYAQDLEGNVWYFGEATKEFKAGGVDTAGSFQAGVNSALPGIIMPAHPQVGDKYRQEYAKGVAEDTGEVLSLTGDENTPLTGHANGLLVTKDANLIDPTAASENKYYARGIGLILTVNTFGPPERDQAITVEKS